MALLHLNVCDKVTRVYVTVWPKSKEKMQANITTAQKEAYLNEYKGGLFEFLCASALYKHAVSDDLTKFYQDIDAATLKSLQYSEVQLRITDPQQLFQLPVIAERLSHFLLEHYGRDWTKVELIGKSSNGKSIWKEADILLFAKDQLNGDSTLPISLKFCKKNSYVNTKSAGVKSFIRKYYGYYENEFPTSQDLLDEKVNWAYHEMAQALHSFYGLIFLHDWQQWSEQKLPQLPGQLDEKLHHHLTHFYYQSILELFRHMKAAFEYNAHAFKESLLPIIGISNSKIIQLMAFYAHAHARESRYQLESMLLINAKWVQNELSQIQLIAPKEGRANFDIKLKNVTLQIRLKPMNKFTSAGLKVNCSILYG